MYPTGCQLPYPQSISRAMPLQRADPSTLCAHCRSACTASSTCGTSSSTKRWVGCTLSCVTTAGMSRCDKHTLLDF